MATTPRVWRTHSYGTKKKTILGLFAFAGLSVVFWGTACGVACPHPGGPVTGPQDAHCSGVTPINPNSAFCQAEPKTGPTSGAVAEDANGTQGATSASSSDYGATMYNASGADDDCKYQVEWTSGTVCRNEPVAFMLRVTRLSDGQPVLGANPRLDVFLSDTHLAPYTKPKVTETADGHYRIDSIKFDAAGMWTVRFHLFETCDDAIDASPHGHAAFFVNVP